LLAAIEAVRQLKRTVQQHEEAIRQVLAALEVMARRLDALESRRP